MSEVAEEGRTVVFVSHNLAIIQALCKRGVLLERGEVVTDAPVKDAINAYLAGLERAAMGDLLERTDRDRRGWSDTMIGRLEVRDEGGGPATSIVAGQPVTISIERHRASSAPGVPAGDRQRPRAAGRDPRQPDVLRVRHPGLRPR